MTLIVEDGSGVIDANTYISVQHARDYAAQRGAVLAIDPNEAASQLVQAFDFIENHESYFGGTRVFKATAFPRQDLVVNGFNVGGTEIPKQVLNAQVQLAIAIERGVDLEPIIELTNTVKKEKIGPIETEYVNPTKLSDLSPQVTTALNQLRQMYGKTLAGQLMLYRA